MSTKGFKDMICYQPRFLMIIRIRLGLGLGELVCMFSDVYLEVVRKWSINCIDHSRKINTTSQMQETPGIFQGFSRSCDLLACSYVFLEIKIESKKKLWVSYKNACVTFRTIMRGIQLLSLVVKVKNTVRSTDTQEA